MDTAVPIFGFQPSLILIPVILIACTPQASQEHSTAAAPGTEMSAQMLLDELNPRGGVDLILAWNGTDPEAVASIYTEDAVVVMDDGTVYRGRAEILQDWLRHLVPLVDDLTPSIEQIVGGPDRMTIIGTYTARISPPDEPPFNATGVFGNAWVRQPDGSWRVQASIASEPARRGG
jgi:uncharacterized protein (TIGR02246 family)